MIYTKPPNPPWKEKYQKMMDSIPYPKAKAVDHFGDTNKKENTRMNPSNPIKEKSEVNIKVVGNGYIIEITDQFTHNTLAVTQEELEKINLYSSAFLPKKS